MNRKINVKKAIIWGFIVFILSGIVSNILWQNPYVAGIYEQFKNHPTIKPMDDFGGIGNWLTITMIFSLLYNALIIIFYLILYQSIPGNGWRKGLNYGMIVGLIKAVPEAFNQYMLFVYPKILIIIQLINSLLSILIFCLLLSIIFKKANVIQVR